MNKKNTFANHKDNEIGWDEFRQMNIVPLGKSVAFDFYLSSLAVDKTKTTTTTLDISLIKDGIDKNLWVACLGEEFYHFCDKRKTIIKRLNSSKNLNTEINWFFCYKTVSKKSKKIEKIINCVKNNILITK